MKHFKTFVMNTMFSFQDILLLSSLFVYKNKIINDHRPQLDDTYIVVIIFHYDDSNFCHFRRSRVVTKHNSN